MKRLLISLGFGGPLGYRDGTFVVLGWIAGDAYVVGSLKGFYDWRWQRVFEPFPGVHYNEDSIHI